MKLAGTPAPKPPGPARPKSGAPTRRVVVKKPRK